MEIEQQNQQGENDAPVSSSPSEDNELETPLIPTSDDDNGGSNNNSEKWAFIQKIVNIYTDQSGSYKNIFTGLSIMFAFGTSIGILMPKNPDLPDAWYQAISSIIGYIYFISWSVSFYPQLITNYQNQSIVGYSTDTPVLAFLNYTCYTLYNVFFFWDETIRQEYRDRHGPDSNVTVQSNDVAFSIHALFLISCQLVQVQYYGEHPFHLHRYHWTYFQFFVSCPHTFNLIGGFRSQPISNLTKGIIFFTLVVSAGYIACIKLYDWLWIDFLYMMASFKLILTIFTYLPQIILNYQRRSTEGFNVWSIIFDCSGGLMSMSQLIFDSIDLRDLKHGLLGNWAKLLLGMVTLFFDVSGFGHVLFEGYGAVRIFTISDFKFHNN